MLSLRSTALALICLVALPAPARSASSPAQAESAEERYSFLVGLCDEKEWQLAAREARAFLEEFPRHAKADLARYRLATALFESGEKQAARDAYAQLERREGFEFRAEVSFRLGQCELGLGRPAQATGAFERVLALGSNYLAPAAQFFLGEANFANGDFAAAEASYQKVLSSKDGAEYEREARYGLCWCSFRLARHDEAVARIEQYLERHGAHATAPELRYLCGEAHLAAGRAREALKSFGTVRTGPFSVRALRGSAFASAALGDHAGAARRFGELLEQAPEGEFADEAQLQRGIQLLLAGDAGGAATALAAHAKDPEAAYWLARAQLESGAPESALSSLETALSARPKGEVLERLAVLRGDALSALGRGGEAAAAYSQARSDYALHAAAIAAFNSGKLDDAARIARDGLERFPQSSYAPEMRLVCGEAALARKDYAEASREFRAASVEGASEATRARAALREAWCALLAGDAKAASELAQRVVRDFATSAGANEARFVLGRAHEKLDDAAGSVAAWKKYIEVEPRGEHAAEALAGLSRLDAKDAARWSRKLAEEHPESAAAFGALLDLAERDAREGRRAQALQRYREVLERWPDHERAPVARYGLAWCLFEAGDFAAAAREVAALAARPELEPQLALSAAELAVWANNRADDREATVAAYRRFAELGGEPRKLLGAARLAGAALSESGRAEEARALFDDLLGKARGEREVQAEVLLESAWIALEAKDADEAEAALRTAWKLGPAASARAALAEACFFAGELRFDAGDHDRARALYELALPAAAPSIAAQALYKSGFAHLRADELDEAATSFTRLASEHAEHELAAESRYLAAECRFRQKRFEECVTLLASFSRDLPRHACTPKALLKLGVSLGELGRWKECEAALVEFARRGAQAEGALESELWRGRAVAARGDARGARAAFDKVVGADRGLLAARARLELGRLDTAAGKHEDALAHYLKVALLYEGGEVVPEALFCAAGALEALGRGDKARARYVELREKYAGSPFAARAEERLDALGRSNVER